MWKKDCIKRVDAEGNRIGDNKNDPFHFCPLCSRESFSQPLSGNKYGEVQDNVGVITFRRRWGRGGGAGEGVEMEN